MVSFVMEGWWCVIGRQHGSTGQRITRLLQQAAEHVESVERAITAHIDAGTAVQPSPSVDDLVREEAHTLDGALLNNSTSIALYS